MSVDASQDATEEPLRNMHTSTLPQLLEQVGVSSLVTNYQTDKLFVLRNHEVTLNTHFRNFLKPMSLAIVGGKLAVGCKKACRSFTTYRPLANGSTKQKKTKILILSMTLVSCLVVPTQPVMYKSIKWSAWIVPESATFSGIPLIDRLKYVLTKSEYSILKPATQ